MIKKTWAYDLACIHERIYDCERNIKDAKWRLASLEVDLKCAMEGSLLHKPNEAPGIRQKIEVVQNYLDKETKALTQYKKMLEEHYKREPK